MKEVSKQEFYEKINPLDVVLSVKGGFGSPVEYSLRNKTLVGKSTYELNIHGRTLYPIQRHYFLAI